VSVGSPGAERQITNVAPGTFGTDAVNVNQLFGGLNKLETKLSQGIVASAALVAPSMPLRPGGTVLGVNGAYYNSEWGGGIGVAHRFNTAQPMMVHGSVATGGGDEWIGRVGFQVEW
jgi:trimeric autotransporter adhesin